jgi:hypothetical protein
MAIPYSKTIKRQNPPTWYGAAIYTYNNNYASASDIIAADYFDDDDFAFGARDVLWAKLNDGYQEFRFTSATTVEVATD